MPIKYTSILLAPRYCRHSLFLVRISGLNSTKYRDYIGIRSICKMMIMQNSVAKAKGGFNYN